MSRSEVPLLPDCFSRLTLGGHDFYVGSAPDNTAGSSMASSTLFPPVDVREASAEKVLRGLKEHYGVDAVVCFDAARLVGKAGYYREQRVCDCMGVRFIHQGPDGVELALRDLGSSEPEPGVGGYESDDSDDSDDSEEEKVYPSVEAFRGAPDLHQIQSFVACLKQIAAEGGTAYIHCGAGYGRTGTYIAAAKMLLDGMSLEESLSYLSDNYPHRNLEGPRVSDDVLASRLVISEVTGVESLHDILREVSAQVAAKAPGVVPKGPSA